MVPFAFLILIGAGPFQDPFGAGTLGAVNDSIVPSVVPTEPLIKTGRDHQALSFDLALENRSGRAATLQRIVLSVLDTDGGTIERRFLSSRTAMVDGITSIPTRTIAPSSTLSVFNPFHRFALGVPLNRIRVEMRFDVDGAAGQFAAELEMHPVSNPLKTALVPPVRGPVLVYDADDLYSHHRRLDVPRIRTMMGQSLVDNPVRFAIDWAPVDSTGALWQGERTDPSRWVAFGATVVAPGGGRVVAIGNDVPDNTIEEGRLIVPDGLAQEAAMLGNFVRIDHGNGEFSELAHLRTGSIRVAVGDRVEAGDAVGEIGFSGDSGFHVHVHHHLYRRTGPGAFDRQTLPLVFERFRVWRGSAWVAVRRGAVETGEIIVADP